MAKAKRPSKAKQDNGIKFQVFSIDEARAQLPERPELEYILPIDDKTILNGHKPTLPQLETIKKHFGLLPTKREIENFLMQKGAYSDRAGWDTVVSLMQQTPTAANKVMDYPIYHDFLKQVAAEVDRLVRNTPQAKEHFTKHIRHFIKMHNDCEVAARKLADPEYDRQEQRHTDIIFRGKSDIEEKPEPARRYATADELPPNPVFWFKCYGIFGDGATQYGNIIATESNTRSADDAEKMMCDFVRLAVIHDWVCTSPTDTAIYFQDKDCPDAQIGGLIWQKLTELLDADCIGSHYADGRKNEKRLTEKALEAVRAALSKPLTIPDMIKALEQYTQAKDIWDFSALPPIGQLYDFLCRAKGQCGAKTTNIMNCIGGAAGNGSGYYPAMLREFMSDEVLRDLRQWDKPQEENKYPNCSHNEDFTAVHWCGIDYTFNKTQGKCIKYLWENEQAHEESIGQYIGTAAGKDYRLKDTFRNHCAWGKMIVKISGTASKGLFALKYA